MENFALNKVFNRYTLFGRLVGSASLLLALGMSAPVMNVGAAGFSEFKKARKQEYTDFRTAYLKRYQDYRQQVTDEWGVAELSSGHEVVRYSQDGQSKVVANFDEGYIEVTFKNTDKALEKMASSQQANFERLQATLKSALDIPVSEVIDTDPVLSHIEKQAKVSAASNNNTLLSYFTHQPIASFVDGMVEVDPVVYATQQVDKARAQLSQQIKGLMAVERGGDAVRVEQQAEKALVDQLAAEKKAIDQNVKTKREIILSKRLTTYRISLNNSRLKRAQKFMPWVLQYAAEWNLSPSFLLAIIEAESSFNPVAQSPIPAFGLMQIVPSSAGLDVNMKAFNIKTKPKVETLFKAEENIKYGSAYLNILQSRYLKEVEDPLSRHYCAIASYNTGVGNLSKAFNNGKLDRLQAIKKINSMTPEQVYQVITSKTHQETQRYLKKVIEKEQYFSEALKKA